jgi:hypothetical protein
MPPGMQPSPAPPYAAPPSAPGGATPPYAQPFQAAPGPPQYAPYPAQYPPPQYPPQYPQQYPPQAQQPQYPQYPPQQPPPQYQAPQPQYAPQAPVQRRGGLPTWLLSVLAGVAFVGLIGGIYWLVGSSHGGSQAATSATVENPAAKAGAKTSSVQKYVEISAIRFNQDAKRNIEVKFLVTNHSDADLSGLAGNVTLFGRTQKSEEDAVGTFSFTADVPPQTSKEVSAPLSTKLKIYEMPDWQNVTTDVQITSPQ